MDTLFEVQAIVLVVTPIIVGLIQIAKMSGMPTKYAPLASLLCGIGLLSVMGGDWRIVFIQGIIAGLSASGLWSGAKTTFKS